MRPPVTLRPKPVVSSDGNREAFLLAQTPDGVNGKEINSDTEKKWRTIRPTEINEEMKALHSVMGREGEVGESERINEGVEIRPRAGPRVLKHTRNSSLQVPNSYPGKHELTRSNSSITSAQLNPTSVKGSTHPVVPPRPNLNGTEMQNRKMRGDPAGVVTEIKRNSCIELEWDESNRRGQDCSHSGCSHSGCSHSGCSHSGCSHSGCVQTDCSHTKFDNNRTIVEVGTATGGDVYRKMSTSGSSSSGMTHTAVDVSKMSWEELVSHVTHTCSELESKQAVIDSIRQTLLATYGSSWIVDGERAMSDSDLLEQLNEAMALLQRYKDKFGEIN